MCDSVAGRFCSKDPIGYVGSRWNLYEFLQSSSMQLPYPTGLACETEPDDPTVETSLAGCLKSPALLWACLNTGVARWSNIGARFAGKGGGAKLRKMPESWGGKTVFGGKHPKVCFGGWCIPVPDAPANGTVISIIKEVLERI